MKRKKIEKSFLEQLEKVPNISLACEKLGLSRNTIYRWCKDSPEFDEQLNKALGNGTCNINDLAESKLISLINQGSIKAIIYWLEHNNRKYEKTSIKELRKEITISAPVTGMKFEIVDNGMPNQDIEDSKTD